MQSFQTLNNVKVIPWSVLSLLFLVCFRPLSPSSVVYVYRLYGETPCWHCLVSTPSAKHAGSSTALYWSKMVLEWVSLVHSVCISLTPELQSVCFCVHSCLHLDFVLLCVFPRVIFKFFFSCCLPWGLEWCSNLITISCTDRKHWTSWVFVYTHAHAHI